MSNPIVSTITLPRTLATGFVIAAIAAVLVMGGRPSSDEPLLSPQPIRPTPTEVGAPAIDAPTFAVSGTPIDATLRELNAMSETYRNTTFLIAIRDAGFICNELLRVYGALDDAPKWLASCSEMLSYTVSVASSGSLHVEPMMQYFDGPVLRIQGNDEVVPPQVLRQQQLPPQELPPRR
jgi:hypothetical protein